MYIEAFHIGGFGIYHEQGVQGLPPGLLVITGENESGKTTLLEFFRFMFFGPERRGPDRNDYQPLLGKERGGRLVLLTREGRRLVVDRREKRLQLSEDGRVLPANLLSTRLGGVDPKTFRAIFAVDLKDLQGLDVLETDQVRSLIFGSAGGAGAAAVPRVLRQLDQELEELLKPRKGGQLNQLLSRLQEKTQELRRLEAAAARYGELQATREHLESRLKARKEEEQRLGTRLARLRQLSQAREPWVALLDARQHLEELKDVAHFPPDGAAEWQRLRQTATELQAESAALAEERDRLTQELTALRPDPPLLANRQAIDALLAEEKRWEEAQAREPEERLAAEQARQEARRCLGELGPEWEEGRLEQVDTSLAVRYEVQEYGRRLQAAERGHEDLLSRERTLAENVAAAEREAEAARARLQAAPPPPGEPAALQARQTFLRRLTPLLTQREVLGVRLAERRRAVEEVEARLKDWESTPEPHPPGMPRWLVPLPAVMAAAVAGAVSYLMGLFRTGGEVSLWLSVAALLFFGLLASLGLAAGRRQALRREAWERETRDRERQLLEARRQGELTEVARLTEEGARLAEELATLARQTGEEPPAGTAEAAAALAELEDLLERWRHWQTLEQEYLRATKQLEEWRKRLEQARHQRQEAGRELEETRQQWTAWLHERGFPLTLKPENVLVLMELVDKARGAVSQERQARERHRRTVAVLTDMRARVAKVLADCGRHPLGPEPGLADLVRLRQDLAEALELENRRQELRQRLALTEEALAVRRRKEREVADAMARLLRRAGAANEADFEARLSRFQEWQKWQAVHAQKLLQLTTIAGSEAFRESLEEELAAHDPVTLAREEADLTRQLQSLREEMSREEREVGSLTRELEHLATERRLGDLLQELAHLREEITRLSRRYVTLALARHLLDTARQVYEREHQPRVIAEADRFLKIMTHQRYRLFAPVGEGGVRLEDAHHRQKEEVHWSAGLADQVYLAVRLGMAREFGRHCEPLPLILDDVLVKFDPRRRRGAARVILECAREQQVLFFSCHPEYAALFRELALTPEFQGLPLGYLQLDAGKMAWAS